ncbi:hypothetical protein C7S20_19240 [Christiangramia fulva]|uniref:XRE family transcriptional regulator n=1 Tax=Christiangramia fulva TaxID=2126553 RepID=A0A2R3ZA69_9FLAO|nr:hypothetical protein [Christiangramia fulva]AVR47213.1 hypothetical protein C7S20_19240 [Christiangramia fulva]
MKTKIETPEARILHFIEHLKESGKVRFKEEVYEKMNVRRQYVTSVKNGEGNKRFTTNHIQALCEHYPVNANWIFGIEKEMYRKEKVKSSSSADS